MGRPLYSRAFRSTPVVREPESPSCEKWSYLNAFDPDSDEFFDNENTVYEDFIGPVTPINPDVEVVEEVDDDDEEEEEERDMLVVRVGNASPITSESSLSDNESPLTLDAENPAHLLVDAFHDTRQIEQGVAESAHVPAARVHVAARAISVDRRWRLQAGDAPRSYARREGATSVVPRTVSHRSHPQLEESLPRVVGSAPIPVPSVPRRSAAIDERVSPSPSTPPRQTPITYLPMSPPPASTPRLYSWTRNPSHSSSPSSSGPFTNPHARTSYAHLSPALIRIRDVTI